MYFGISPIAGTILAIILIVWLIGSGIKSAGKKLPETDVAEPMSIKDIRKALGTTWKDEVIGFLIILLLASIVACILLRL